MRQTLAGKQLYAQKKIFFRKEVVKPKISYRKVGRKAVPSFTYEANSDIVGPQNKWSLLEGDDDFQIACSCLR